MAKAFLPWAQGEEMPQISRFQAQAVGSRVYIHNHRSLQDILMLDVSDSNAPVLSLQPVTADPEPPMSRQAAMRMFCHIFLLPWAGVLVQLSKLYACQDAVDHPTLLTFLKGCTAVFS